ncbi:MAG: hypothetical protein RLZZ413_179 [Pseudomonadota bacterium]
MPWSSVGRGFCVSACSFNPLGRGTGVQFRPPDGLSERSVQSSVRRGDEAGGYNRAGPAGLLRSGLIDEEDHAGAACVAEHGAQDPADSFARRLTELLRPPDQPSLGQRPRLQGTKPDVQRPSSAFLSIRLMRLCSRSAPVASPDPVQARLNVRFGPRLCETSGHRAGPAENRR